MKKKVFLFMLIMFIVGFISCKEEDEEENQNIRIRSDVKEIYIENITFEQSELLIFTEQLLYVRVDVSPVEGKRYDKVKYSVSEEGIVRIVSENGDGIILEGLEQGTVTITAESKNAVGHLNIRVEKPYIFVATPVIVMEVGQVKPASVSLNGESNLYSYGFEWNILPKEDGSEDSISIIKAYNLVLITGLKEGTQKIQIENEKAEYPGEIVVIVYETNNSIGKYITCNKNTMILEMGQAYEVIEVRLEGGDEEDNKDFVFTIANGAENIDIISDNEKVEVRALKVGSSIIRVMHPLAFDSFDIRVICFR